jgi:hypothetical protein
MDGIGAQNNAAIAFGRFALVAPTESEKTPAFVTAADIPTLTNRYLYVIDTKITKGSPEEPRRIDLGAFYPGRVRFNERTENAVVAATALEEDPETGELRSYRVMVLVHLHLTDNKAEATGEPVIIKVPGINGEETNPEASGEFYLSNRNLIFFTGPSVCVFDLDEGNLNTVELIPAKNYGINNYACFGGFDPDTSILTVVVNTSEEAAEGGELTRSTALRFFKLRKDGSLRPVGVVERFPEKEILSEDSEVAIQSKPDDPTEAQAAFVVTNTGNLYSIDLASDSAVAQTHRLSQFPSLAQGSGEAGPRILRLDHSTGTLFIWSPGSVPLNIRRPVFGRPARSGGIRRPVFARSNEQSRILAARVNSQSMLVSVNDLSYIMAADVNVAGLVQTSDGQWVFAGSNGETFVVGTSESGDVKAAKLGDLGHPRVESVAYNVERNSLVALCSSGEPEQPQGGTSIDNVGIRGAVVIAKLNEGASSAVTLSVSQMHSPSQTPSVVGSKAPSIRRPCNIGR